MQNPSSGVLKPGAGGKTGKETIFGSQNSLVNENHSAYGNPNVFGGNPGAGGQKSISSKSSGLLYQNSKYFGAKNSIGPISSTNPGSSHQNIVQEGHNLIQGKSSGIYGTAGMMGVSSMRNTTANLGQINMNPHHVPHPEKSYAESVSNMTSPGLAYNRSPSLSTNLTNLVSNEVGHNQKHPALSTNSITGQIQPNFNNYNNELSHKYFNQNTANMIPDNISIKSSSNSRVGMSSRENPLQRGRGDSTKWIEEERNRSLSRRGSANSMEHRLESMSKLSTGGMSAGLSHGGTLGGGHHFGRSGKDPKAQAFREEIELVRSKNKALFTVNKEKFPDFLKRLEDMRSTVQMNITYSFTSRLRDIWSSYIKDQKQRKAILDDRALMDELKPIEEAFVNF
jgi:hypothetical protein